MMCTVMCLLTLLRVTVFTLPLQPFQIRDIHVCNGGAAWIKSNSGNQLVNPLIKPPSPTPGRVVINIDIEIDN